MTDDQVALNDWYPVADAVPAPARVTRLLGDPLRIAFAGERPVVTAVAPDGSELRGLPVAERFGLVWTTLGSPVKDVTIEIWQCDANEVYLHTGDSESKKDQQDKNFQGFGRFTTASTGEYRFRTIKPVPYPGRTPHIHVKIKKGDRELLTTQFFINGHPQNRSDGIFMGAGGPLERELVLVDFKPIKDSKIGELAARMDVVLGRTPAEAPHDEPRPRRGRP